MRIATGLLAGAVMLAMASGGAAAAAERPRVVVTIKPVHALVAAVMEGVAEPELLLTGGSSPHSYALKPSQARSLADARLVVRVSENLETFLNNPIETLAADSRVLTVEDIPGLTLHEVREGGVWEGHAHGEEAHEEETHEEKGYDHKHEHAGEHDAHEKDTHLWLDPVNARGIVSAVGKELSRLWPGHATAFAANARRLSTRIAALHEELTTATARLHGKPYVVFHDAYRYFEERYGLHPAGSITVSPDRAPGAKRLLAIRDRIEEAGAICVFAEPQFEPKLVATLTEGTPARRAVLDPLGAALPEGPGLYFRLMRGLAADLTACLSP